jgi:hypothetical protein
VPRQPVTRSATPVRPSCRSAPTRVRPGPAGTAPAPGRTGRPAPRRVPGSWRVRPSRRGPRPAGHTAMPQSTAR